MKGAPALGLVLLARPTRAAVYKWADDAGRAHDSDVPPFAGTAPRLKLQTHTGPAQIRLLPHAARGVTLCTTQWCGVCKQAKAFLSAKRIPRSEWDVEQSNYGAAKFRQLGGQGVPLITVGAQTMLGFDAKHFMQLWQAEQARP